MASYSRKYLFRLLLFSLSGLILIILIASALFNFFLASAKNTLEQNLSEIFNQEILIERISFFPANFITVKNFSIRKTGSERQNPPVLIEKVKCVFSLWMLIVKRDFVIVNIDIDNPSADYSFVRENLEEFIEAVRSLAQKEPLEIRIKKARLNFVRKEAPPRRIAFEGNFKIHPGRSVISSGLIDLENAPLSYSLRVLMTKQGFMIEALDLVSSQFSSKLWGILENNILTLNGSSSFSKFSDLSIYDLACVVKFNLPIIIIEKAGFSLKNVPFALKGAVSFAQSPMLNLKFASFPNQPEEARVNNPKRFDMDIAGILRKGKFNGAVNLYFLRKARRMAYSEKIETIFKNLTFLTSGNGMTKMSFEEATVDYASGNNLYNIFLKDYSCLLNFENNLIKFVDINSGIYDGFLEGEGTLRTNRTPFRASFDINITGASADKFHNLLPYCSKIYGNLTSQIKYRNYPGLNLTGELVIKDGYLNNIIFFNWVEDLLKVPSLNRINFEKLSAKFIIDGEHTSLEGIRLESKNVGFEGYFTLYENDLVSSKLSLSISKSLLMESLKLQRLFNYLAKDVSFLRFHFQLSGFFQAMNFKWLESDFKQELQDLLPRRLEQRLESEVEKIIESISAEQTLR